MFVQIRKMVVMGLGLVMALVLTATTAEASAITKADGWFELHGPEKPPPDDGYEFKGANGGNGLGKLGLASMGAGLVTSVLYLAAEEDSEREATMGRNSLILLGGGFALLVVERAR